MPVKYLSNFLRGGYKNGVGGRVVVLFDIMCACVSIVRSILNSSESIGEKK